MLSFSSSSKKVKKGSSVSNSPSSRESEKLSLITTMMSGSSPSPLEAYQAPSSASSMRCSTMPSSASSLYPSGSAMSRVLAVAKKYMTELARNSLSFQFM